MEPNIPFNTSSPGKLEYENFIVSIRDAVAKDEVHGPHGYKVLKNPKDVPITQRFILVNLTNKGGETVTLAIDVTNLFVVAYRTEKVAHRTGKASFFFKEQRYAESPYNTLFNGTERRLLGFGGMYDGAKQLEHTAAAKRTIPLPSGGEATVTGRRAIELGIEALDKAIGELYKVDPIKEAKKAAHHLIVVIQMVSEAVRFKQIEQDVKDSIIEEVDPNSRTPVRRRIISYRPFWPNALTLTLENSWDPLSDQIHQATDATFLKPVTLNPSTGYSQDAFTVDKTDSWKLFTYVAVIKHPKQGTQNQHQPSHNSQRQGRQNQNQPSTSRRK